ncbi:MAG TPA: hypothetical protein VGK24_00220 [Candidatus Angelobacter sp.]|jgi:hypothetical protein
MAEVDPQQVIGTVVSTQGTWCDQAHMECTKESRGVWRMYNIHRDSELILLVPPVAGRGEIQIRSRWGFLENFDCSKPREQGCKAPLDLARLVPAQPKKNVVTAFFDAVLELASTHPKVYDGLSQGILQTRQLGREPSLSDGVVELRKDGLSLGDILNNSRKGAYWLELCPVDESGKPKCPEEPQPLQYLWDPVHPTPLPVSIEHSGIYSLYLCKIVEETAVRTPSYAELLVADPSQYQQLHDDFRRAVGATRGWDAEDPTAPTLRRIYLHALATH